MTPQERYDQLRTLPVRTIAVWRPLKLGDFLVSLPALRALKQAFPEARIDFIGRPGSEELVDRFNTYLHELVRFPGLPGIPEQAWDPAHTVRFLKDMQARRYDLLLQLQGSGRLVNQFVALCGAKFSAGFAEAAAFCPDKQWFMPYPQHMPEILLLLKCMAFLGLPADNPALEFPITPADRAELAALADMRGVTGPYVCIHVGASSSRPWGARHFATVADACISQGLTVVLTGAKTELTRLRQVATYMRQGRPVLLGGKTSLGALAALLDGAQAYIGNDTGPSHLAVAVSTPSVTIFSTADPARWAPLDQKRHAVILPHDASPRKVMSKLREVLSR